MMMMADDDDGRRLGDAVLLVAEKGDGCRQKDVPV
jgi:hypothetical protein